MKMETLKKDNKKKIVIGIIAVISITLVGVLAGSFAKYKLTQSIPLVDSTINYTVPDLNIIAIYQENEAGEYDKVDTMPTDGYTFSSESYCATIGDNGQFTKDTNITINYDMNTKIITAGPTTKRTRCYLYFDKIRDTEKPVVSKIEATEVTKTSITVKVTASDNEGVTKYLYSINNGTYTETTTNTHTFSGLTKGTSYTISVKAKDAAGNESVVKTTTIATENDAARDIILGKITVNSGTPNFANAATTDEGVFKAQDNDGTSYYFRGNVTNNYLTFAGFWWRIIRINGDGTIRIIYDGTAYHANGTSTSDSQIGTSYFNSSTYDNAHVGFMYGTPASTTYEATHANTNKSTILTALETWYNNNLATYASKIDTNAGFCGDRRVYSYGPGIGSNQAYYAARNRLIDTKALVLTCNAEADLYTMKGAIKGNKALDRPIGLISADEAAMAGGVYNTSNNNYYLYNGQSYWTISPWYFNGPSSQRALVLIVTSSGTLTGGSVGHWNYSYEDGGPYGVRPVINLKADVAITGTGTQNDPYVVSS